MILQAAQRKRFYRIFNTFILFARDRLMELGVLSQTMARYRMPSNAEVNEIERAIWGEDGHLEVIDEFVAECTSLSRSDLRALESWKQGIYENFYVLRRGADTLFAAEGYIFAVRGISHEIDDDAAVLPGVITCVLVPFDGVITYLVCLGTYGIDLDIRDADDYAKGIEKTIKKGNLARSEKQFLRLAPLAKEAARESRAQREREQAEFEEHGDDVVEGQHQSILSRLREEGKDAPSMTDLHNAVEAGVSELIIGALDRACLRGRPVTSLEKVLGRYPVEELRGVEGTDAAWRMKKAEVVSRLCARYLDQAALLAKEPLRFGATLICDIMDLCDEGGTKRLRRDEITGPEVVPLPQIAYVNYFHEGDDYVIVLPDEIGAAFKDLDFEDVRAKARRFEDVLKYLVFVCDSRGLMRLEEARQGLAERFGDFTEEELGRFLEQDYLMPVVELDGETYVVAFDLVLGPGKDEGWELDEDVARKILEEQVGTPAWWPSVEECVYRSVFDMATKVDEGRALMDFLEAHVPDDENDITFPREFMRSVVRYTLAPLDPQDNVDTVTDLVRLVAFSMAQADRVMRLISALVNVLPKRVLNGYSPVRYDDEVRGGKGPEKIAFVHSTI